jgi:hypothetical protein
MHSEWVLTPDRWSAGSQEVNGVTDSPPNKRLQPSALAEIVKRSG